MAAVRRLVVEIVVAADAVPGQAHRADDAVEAIVERQVVEQQVAQRQAEAGRGAPERREHVVADEVELRIRLGLGVGEHHDVEALRLVLAAQREVDRGRQRPRRGHALVGEVERGRRAVRLVEIEEAGQQRPGFDRGHVARRLDDEDDRLVRHRQRVAPVGVRHGDVAAVRHQHAGKAGARRGIGVVEDAACDGARGRGGRRGRLGVGARRSQRQGDAAGRRAADHVTPRDPIPVRRHAASFRENDATLAGRRDGPVTAFPHRAAAVPATCSRRRRGRATSVTHMRNQPAGAV